VATKTAPAASAAPPPPPRAPATARTPSRERVIDGSTSPCEWP